MRNDERFEIERAMDLLPHVAGASWASVWFRMRGEKGPTREEFRERCAHYMGLLGPLFDSYPDSPEFAAISGYVAARRDAEIRRILEGGNKEVEKRYDRYVDYG
ncbi:MAG: hypothetical protein MPI95_01330 [Nitrosopumilus sp.]|nr:hypothetical protein [Nitrosopumilus sp.]CAI9832180.1 conserved hypothetical protein [Nitrosopumilaceae archaeon]MDA7941325.1 hypothetical protein [Nitrosopumilus sp.]MDA7945620.1 hypothetical protein [Nitrosopumilus sp.]MDA7952750.1 hypothetical protein [Nitrosopumilus sp.]